MAGVLQDNYIWWPQPRQAVALTSPAFELFFGGAKGGGKSDFLLADFTTDYEYWGEAWRGILFRREYKELEEIINRSHQIYGKIPGAYYKGGQTDRTWYLPAPHAKYPGYATLRLRNLKNMQDVGEYNGHQYPWIAFDELTEHITPGPYEFMIGCSRSAFGAPCRIRASGNPGRPGHGWVKSRFIDVAKPFEFYIDPRTGLSRTFIPSRLEDNQILMQNDPEYEQRLLTFQPHLVKALRWGDWDVIVGQVLSEFSRDKHVIPKTALDQSWYRFCSLDWGFARPFSINWFAVNEDGRVILYKEWYGSTGNPNEGLRMGAREVAKKAWDMSVDENVTVMVADPACWSKNDETSSIAETFEEAGFEMIRADNDRKNGLQALHDLMMATGHDGRPMFLVMENCHHWMRTVPYLSADPANPEDVDTEGEDHCFASGTLVSTKYGEVPIEKICPGDEVLTRKGYLKVLDRWDEGYHETVIANFDNGSILEVTPSHKIWVKDKGFTRIDSMRYGDIIYVEVKKCKQIKSYLTGSFLEDTLSQKGRKIRDTLSLLRVTVKEVLSRFTGKYGKPTMAQSQKDTISTTSMEMQAITQSLILNVLSHAPIFQNIQKGESKIQMVEARTPLLGIRVKKATNGTRFTLLKCGLIKRIERLFVLFAVKNTNPGVKIRTTSIAQEYAAPVRFVGITRGTIKEVHDLSVSEVHEYYANGILVSNCYDSTRYGIMSEYVRNPKILRRPAKMRATSTKPNYDPLTYKLR